MLTYLRSLYDAAALHYRESIVCSRRHDCIAHLRSFSTFSLTYLLTHFAPKATVARTFVCIFHRPRDSPESRAREATRETRERLQ